MIMKTEKPSYLNLKKDEIKKRAEKLWNMMKQCQLCPRMCKTNRLAGKKGFCGTDDKLIISSYHQHFGEEKPLVGINGSGTIFFSNCSLKCIFCQNWEISHARSGIKKSIEDLSEMMITLQKAGSHNINLVTPTHYLPHILFALDIAIKKGLKIPIVYNTSGYELVEIIKQLDGIVDIYLPDFKYFDTKMAEKFSSDAKDYPEYAKNAILEMHRQVGVAITPNDGIMKRGLMIRHLVMPNNVSGSKEIIKWISENLPKNTYINIMSQYYPYYRAPEFAEISREIEMDEYYEVIEYAKKCGLTNVEIQGY
ncbi:MAG: radical SAM protein [Candidatus Goldbacteria bacterium]|nr:radical SAM protein [Candidatus Goldiibacteriota bacterium]